MQPSVIWKYVVADLLFVLCIVSVLSSPEEDYGLHSKRSSNAKEYKGNHGQSEEGDSDR